MIPKNKIKKTVATKANSTIAWPADPSLEIPFLQSYLVYRLVLIHPPGTEAGPLVSYTHDRFPGKGERRGEAGETNQGHDLHLGVYLQIGNEPVIHGAIGHHTVGGQVAVRALAIRANGDIIGTEHGGIVQRRLLDPGIVGRGSVILRPIPDRRVGSVDYNDGVVGGPTDFDGPDQ